MNSKRIRAPVFLYFKCGNLSTNCTQQHHAPHISNAPRWPPTQISSYALALHFSCSPARLPVMSLPVCHTLSAWWQAVMSSRSQFPLQEEEPPRALSDAALSAYTSGHAASAKASEALGTQRAHPKPFISLTTWVSNLSNALLDCSMPRASEPSCHTHRADPHTDMSCDTTRRNKYWHIAFMRLLSTAASCTSSVGARDVFYPENHKPI